MASFQLGLGVLGLWMVNSEGEGNEICFHPHPNWINLHLTYEDCLCLFFLVLARGLPTQGLKPSNCSG